VEGADFLERTAGGDGIDEEEALAGAHILLPHRAIFLLTSRVENIEQCDLVVNHTLLSVGILDCGVILVYEMALDELNGERRLADTTTADDDELVLPEKLSPGLLHDDFDRKCWG